MSLYIQLLQLRRYHYREGGREMHTPSGIVWQYSRCQTSQTPCTRSLLHPTCRTGGRVSTYTQRPGRSPHALSA